MQIVKIKHQLQREIQYIYADSINMITREKLPSPRHNP